MKIKAAVIREPWRPYSIEELELEPPKEKEALIKYAYTGYCHSDLSTLHGSPQVIVPRVGGHECAGIVRKSGRAARK